MEGWFYKSLCPSSLAQVGMQEDCDVGTKYTGLWIYFCQNKCCLQHSCPTHPCGPHKSLCPQQNQHRATLRVLPPHTSQGIDMDATPRGRRIRVLSSSEVGVAAGLHWVRFRVISGVHLLPHPPYSTSDLSPCNWFLFQYINKQPYTTVREFMRATTYRHFLWLCLFFLRHVTNTFRLPVSLC